MIMFPRKVIYITRSLLRKDFHAYGLARLRRLNYLSVTRYHQKSAAENKVEGKHDKGEISADDPLRIVSTPIQIPEELKSALEISQDDILGKIQNERNWEKVIKLMASNLDLPVIREGLQRLAGLHTTEVSSSQQLSASHDENMFERNEFQIIFDYFRTLEFQNSEQVHQLLSCYKSLLILNTPFRVITQLEQLFKENMRLISVPCLASLIKICMSKHYYSKGSNLFFSAKDTIMDRWSECTKPEEMIEMLHLIEKTRVIYTKEDIKAKALELLPLMSPKDVVAVIHLLSKCKIRDFSLLNPMANGLTREQLMQEFEVKDYTKLLFDCSSLNFYQPSLLSNVSECLRLKISDSTAKFYLLSAFQSFARLHYKDQQTLDSIYLKFISNSQKTIAQEIARLLISLATLNYTPSCDVNNLLSLVKECYAIHKVIPTLWLDMVWSLMVLNLADEFVIASVLNPDFCTSLAVTTGGSHSRNQSKVKLMNVDHAAVLDLENYKGPRLLPTAEDPAIPMADRSMLLDVITASQNFVPNEKHIQIRRFVPQGGYIIDVEMCVDAMGKTIPLTEDMKTTDNQETHRIALKVLDFHDMTIPDQQPIGPNVMAIRHLKKLGYKVIEVPYYSWSQLTDQRAKVRFIEKKILEVI